MYIDRESTSLTQTQTQTQTHLESTHFFLPTELLEPLTELPTEPVEPDEGEREALVTETEEAREPDWAAWSLEMVCLMDLPL